MHALKVNARFVSSDDIGNDVAEAVLGDLSG
jgi:hypothetical protein